MADPFVAEIRVFGFNFAPLGWAFCNGQVLPIGQNTALFSLIGTFYGGDGRSNFALPNLQEHFAVDAGNGPGLTPRNVGETGGQAAVTLTSAQMPAHTHALKAGVTPVSTSPAGAVMAPATGAVYRIPGVLAPMAGGSVGSAGNSTPHENRQPWLAMNFCIALNGIFPPRS